MPWKNQIYRAFVFAPVEMYSVSAGTKNSAYETNKIPGNKQLK